MVHTVVGSSWLPAWFLSALCPALERGMSVRWIDAGNRFDAYGLGRTARDSGADPRRVLNHVRLARPFNAFQLESMLGRLGSETGPEDPVVVSDPLALLYDEELPDEEARRLAPRLARALKALPSNCVVLTVERQTSPERAALGEAVLAASDRVVSLAEQDGPLSLTALGCAEFALASA
ncbi:MAG: hypothetical protein HY928_08450 [Elusimicrobia bacterium]|nr:hypothetical protein [Elusimicrobiota bacterium]